MNMLNRIVCWLVGHRHRVLKKYGPRHKKVGCRRCKQVWCMADRMGIVVPWDGQIESDLETLLEMREWVEELSEAKRHRDYLRRKR